jgi:hypothetical protein
MIIITLFSAYFASLTAPPLREAVIYQPEKINPYNEIIHAVTTIESSNGANLYNAKEQAVGWFGIRPIRLEDYNKRTGQNITHAQCYDYEIGRMIFLYYASQVDYRDIKGICIAWNGVSKENKYYAKIKAVLHDYKIN